MRANVCVSANHLRHGSDILERFVKEGALLVVGAEYSLETGEVDFFDGVEGSGLKPADTGPPPPSGRP